MHDELKMTFDPMTIEHLGVRMYSTLPPVLAELVANAYDADADSVEIVLRDEGELKEIIVSDDGTGMTFGEINDKFLRIGRNRRTEEGDSVSPKGRKRIGKKGLGKLAFFGIAHEIEIVTRKDGRRNSFRMDWEDIKNPTIGKEYTPLVLERDSVCGLGEHGTALILKRIQRDTDFDPERLANSLARIFIVDPSFIITVCHNSEPLFKIDNERKYAGLKKEVEWGIPEDSPQLESDYTSAQQIRGNLFTTEKPIPPNTNMRGVTLFSRKKLVNLPEYFSDSTSSHFFSYLTGWLEVDFIDELGEDVISTNRQSLNWGHPDMAELRKYLRTLLNKLEQDWRGKRAALRAKKLNEKTGIDVTGWMSKLPPDVRGLAEPILQSIMKDAELPTEATSAAVVGLHGIIPEYPTYHWRHLHPAIREIAKDDYINERYFDAAEKASRLYIQRVKERAAVDSGKDDNDMDAAFNAGSGRLMVTACDDTTKKNIQSGQHMFSKGIVFGCRNPLTHNPEYDKRLVETGLFTEKDCLDLLSLISHLFGRLDVSSLRPASGSTVGDVSPADTSPNQA
jgi:uncharacterized protein (TIGR02391 family)